jgi:molybdopterin biosynthesis enzyme
VTQPLSAEERATLKSAAFGAVYLVSNAEPGALSMIKESLAASNAFARTTGLVRELLTTGNLPQLPTGASADVPATVLPALRRSVEILRTKAPGEVASYRSAVLHATEVVARAHDGISANEAAVLARVREALDAADSKPLDAAD